MRKLIGLGLAASIAVLASGLSALAADMPVKAPVASHYDWSGFYVGGNVGYGINNDASKLTEFNPGSPPVVQESYGLLSSGWIGGAQAGFNWQVSNWVLGVETDIQASGQKSSACVGICASPTGTFIANVDQELTWLGTTRARLGVARDRTLFYATGGAAYGRVKTSVVSTYGAFGTGTGSADTVKTGWTVGGGIEAALAGNWSAKVEYLYVDLGSQTVSYTSAGGGPVEASSEIKEHIGRVGLNYRFGQSAPAADSAAYAAAPGHWSGFYAGLNGGYGMANDSATWINSAAGVLQNNESFKLAPNGFVGGGQIGYNWQLARWVAGIEADFQGSAQRNSACVVACFQGTFLSIGNVEQKLPWFGTVRGRLGYDAMGGLWYVTGGLAYGSVTTDATFTVFTGTTPSSAQATKTGWTIGGGVEAPISGHWTIKAEYLYVDLGSQTLNFTDTNGRSNTVSAEARNNIVRAGLNYRFGSY